MDLSCLSDVELLDLLRENNYKAYKEIYLRYSKTLYMQAFKLLKDEDEAADVMQDALITIWEKRDTLIINQSFSGYLHRLLRNKILDLFARDQVRQKYEQSLQNFIDAMAKPADEKYREKQLRELIDEEVSQLPNKMQAVFKLSRNDGLTHKEIGEALNISDKTVKKQINNALSILRMRIAAILT